MAALAQGCSGGPAPLQESPPAIPAVADSAPRLAVAFLTHDAIDPAALARFDLVVVDMEWAHRDPAELRRIRALNPRVKLLAYVTAQEILDGPTLASTGSGFQLRQQLAAGIHPDWYLSDGHGAHAIFFPNTWMLNPTTGWTDYLAGFVANRVLTGDLFDGVFYDNAWASPTWLGQGAVDLDRDGRPDGAEHGARWIAETWNAAIVRLFARTRSLRPSAMIVGNGSAAGYERYGDFAPRHHIDLNGALDEHWPTLDPSWPDAVRRAEGWLSRARRPALFVEAADTNQASSPTADLRGFRFALTTALLTDSYFAYDRGDHAQDRWWYDEYDAAGRGRGYLGRPRGPRRPLPGGLWAREFDGGLVVVNPLDGPRSVRLPGGPWSYIAGHQDPVANPGGTATQLTLGPRDGRVLLRSGGR